MKETDLAWAAGFLDGEGSVSQTSNNRKMAVIRLSATQNDKRPLERLSNILGGKVNGPYKNKNRPNANGHYMWALSSLDCFQAVELLLPYLSEPKREQIWIQYIKYEIAQDRGLTKKRVSICKSVNCNNEKSSKQEVCYVCQLSNLS